MKVRLRTIYAHPAHGCCSPGAVLDVNDEEAKRLIAAGYADEVKTGALAAARESQAVKPPENAMQSGAPPKAPKGPKAPK